ncbi:MAG: hypothetical protein QXJ36_06395 [Desulfurococcaceae archaeon]
MSTEIERYLYYPEITPRRKYSADFFKILALSLVFIGLIGIYFASTTQPAPVYKIRDIVGNFYLNYATVMIEGRIVQPVRLDLQTGGRIRLTIYIVDEEGGEVFQVFVYDPVASQLITSDNYVDFGDIVRLLIQIRVREDFTYGILQDVNHVINVTRSWRNPFETYSLADIDEYSYVCVRGVVSNARNVSAGLLIDLTTAEDTVTILVPRTFNYRFKGREDYGIKWKALNTVGSMMKICGPVYYYTSTSPEIVVVRYEDVEIGVKPEAPEISINELGNYLNERVSVSGLFYKLSYDSTTYRYVVSIFDKGVSVSGYASRAIVKSAIDPWIVGIGSKIRLTGIVVSNTQLNIEYIEVLETKPPLNTTNVGEALDQTYGTIIILWNVKVVSTQSISGNWNIVVSDDRNSITIFIPSSVAGGMSRIPPVGSIIALAGYRDVYGNTQQIVIYSENGLKILKEPEYKPISLQEIGDHVNEYVSVVGELVSIRYVSGIYYVSIRENNVTVNATMSRDKVIVINPWFAGPGTKLRINGTVVSSNLIAANNVEVVERVETPKYTISEALRQPHGTIVALVNVKVTSARIVGNNNWSIEVVDDNGDKIVIYIPRSVVNELGRDLPSPGSVISIAGYRDIYRGTEEIVVYSSEGFK